MQLLAQSNYWNECYKYLSYASCIFKSTKIKSKNKRVAIEGEMRGILQWFRYWLKFVSIFPDIFFNQNYDRCYYCMKCHDARGDSLYYSRGKPPKTYGPWDGVDLDLSKTKALFVSWNIFCNILKLSRYFREGNFIYLTGYIIVFFTKPRLRAFFSSPFSDFRRLLNNYSSSPNGLRVNNPWGRRPNGPLTQRPCGREE